MATRYLQSKNHVAQVILAGRDIGIWDKAEGFVLSSDDIKYGEGPVAGGVRSRDDGTCRRRYSDVDAGLEGWLEDHVNTDAIIIRSKKGDDGLPMGQPRTYTGTLKSVGPPEGDKTASDPSELMLVFLLNVPAS